MTENRNESQYANLLLVNRYDHQDGEADQGGHFAPGGITTVDANESVIVGDGDVPNAKETILGVPETKNILSFEETESNLAPTSLEDYKCPICLDTFINTVKVDCSYGHKFCNFCIQCWINFERHLVTECPVCRGPIFGKSLDLKTDAEIRAIYDTLSEEEKGFRLLSIKERLQLEYPNSNIQQEFQTPARFSDIPHHHFNHDLHIPIPLVGVMDGPPTFFTANGTQENAYNPNFGFGPNSAQAWPQGMLYPSTWNNGQYSHEFQYVNNIPPPYQTQSVDYADADIHHQHYHHQSQENSRWDNNLYLTHEDTATPNVPSSSRRLLTVTTSSTAHPHTRPPLLEPQRNISGQNQVNEIPDYSCRTSTVTRNPQPFPFENTNLQGHAMAFNSPILNYSPAIVPQTTFNQDQYPTPLTPHLPLAQTQITTQQAGFISPNRLNGYYCCYIPTCPSQCLSSPNSHFSPYHHQNSRPHTTCPHHAISGACSGHHQVQCPNVNGIPTETRNIIRGAGVIPTNSYPVPRIRPNMPGSNSTSIQLPSPNSAISGRSQTPTCGYHRVSTLTNNNNAQSRIGLPVLRCPANNNNRAHFSGGFSLFSSGYMGFQISHAPTTMVIGDGYVSMPPARLTHPLVSLAPLNQDGSSARVCLTFEVHRV